MITNTIHAVMYGTRLLSQTIALVVVFFFAFYYLLYPGFVLGLKTIDVFVFHKALLHAVENTISHAFPKKKKKKSDNLRGLNYTRVILII